MSMATQVLDTHIMHQLWEALMRTSFQTAILSPQWQQDVVKVLGCIAQRISPHHIAGRLESEAAQMLDTHIMYQTCKALICTSFQTAILSPEWQQDVVEIFGRIVQRVPPHHVVEGLGALHKRDVGVGHYMR